MKSLLPVLLALLPALALAAGWERHTVDGSSKGADGVRLADANGDGLPDIATGWEEGGIVRICLHPGREKVREPWPAVKVGAVGSPEDAVIADVDGDGAPDVVSCSEGSTRAVHVHWAPRDRARILDPGAWRTEAFPGAPKVRWMFALPLDADGDGRLDLVVGSKEKGAAVGWLRAPGSPRDLAAWRYAEIRPAGWIMSLRAEDMDGDGDLDVLASDRKGAGRGIFYLERTAAGFRERPIAPDLGETMFLARSDIDGDGRRDAIAAVKGGPIAFLRATGDASSPWERRSIPIPAGCGTGKAVAAGDIDLDGRADIAFTCEGADGGKSGVRWLSPEAGGAGWRDHEVSGPEGTKFDLLELYDLDGDGDLDILTCEEADDLGVLWYENPAKK
jgi:hypothetical protein